MGGGVCVKKFRFAAALLVVAGLISAVGAGPSSALAKGDEKPEVITQKIIHKLNDSKGDSKYEAKVDAKARTNLISYHNGPVMLGTPGVYLIWYGNWGTNTATTILPDMISHLGGSPYYNINTTYYSLTGSTKNYISNSLSLKGQTSMDTTKYGTSLTDAEILSIVTDTINAGVFPKDANAIYGVFTAEGIAESSGFLTQYCGWHTHATVSGSDVKYMFVGNPGTNTACAAQNPSPNNNVGADAMASVIAHEIEEAVTDPDLNAWYDRQGAENADKCAWTFGTTYTVSNGSKANMKLGTRDYYIQRNWDATLQGCYLSR